MQTSKVLSTLAVILTLEHDMTMRDGSEKADTTANKPL